MMNHKGFTLVEILISMVVSLVMLLAVYVMVNLSQWTSTGIERKVVAQQDEKAALELMEMEIRMVSYNPTFTGNIWLDMGDCFNPAANQLYLGIQEATANSLTIEMDIDGSTAVADHPNEIIRYNYDSANQYITRETRTPTKCGDAVTEPFLGANPASGKPRSVKVINGSYNPAIPVFRYFNGTGAEIAAASLPGAIPNIRRIMITLAVETEHPNPATKQPKRMVYSTNVILRNHAPGL